MHSLSRISASLGEELPKLVLPLAFLAASAAYAQFHIDPANAAEVRFLAFLGSVVLLCLGAIAPRTDVQLPLVCLLATLCLWGLPAGTVRAASFFVVLTAALAMTAWDLWRRGQDRDLRGPTVAWAIALQALFQPEAYLLASISVDFLFSAIVAPAVAFLAVARLRLRSGPAIWLGLLALLILNRGVTTDAALALATIAAVETLFSKRSSAWFWALAVTAMAVAPAWDPRSLGLTLAYSVVLGLLTVEVRYTWLFALGAAAALAIAMGGAAVSKLVNGAITAVLLLPALLRPVHNRAPMTLGLLALGLAAGAALPGSEGLLGVALVLLATSLPRRGPASRLQVLWLGALAVAAALAANYPWLRSSPFEAAIAFWGLGITWRSALIVIALFWSLVLVFGRLAGPRSRLALESSALCLILLALFTRVPKAQTLIEEPFVLTTAAGARELKPPGRILHLFLDTYLSNSEDLPAGTPVAKIFASDGATSKSLVLRVGEDTGDWAALRPGLDLSASMPPPHLSWLAPDGRYLAQSYRATMSFAIPTSITALRVERLDELGSQVEVTVLHVGVLR